MKVFENYHSHKDLEEMSSNRRSFKFQLLDHSRLHMFDFQDIYGRFVSSTRIKCVCINHCTVELLEKPLCWRTDIYKHKGQFVHHHTNKRPTHNMKHTFLYSNFYPKDLFSLKGVKIMRRLCF